MRRGRWPQLLTILLRHDAFMIAGGVDRRWRKSGVRHSGPVHMSGTKKGHKPLQALSRFETGTRGMDVEGLGDGAHGFFLLDEFEGEFLLVAP